MEKSPASELPLGFCRQPLANVFAESGGVFERDVNDGVVVAAVGKDVAVGALWVPPVGSFDRKPPRSVFHGLGDLRFCLGRNENTINFWTVRNRTKQRFFLLFLISVVLLPAVAATAVTYSFF